MAFTYDLSLLGSSALYRVRAELGDTTSPGVLADEEISLKLARSATEKLAIADCADMAASRVALDPSRWRDALGAEAEWEPDVLIGVWRRLASRLRGETAVGPTTDYPLAPMMRRTTGEPS